MARPADDVRPAHDLAQLEERADGRRFGPAKDARTPHARCLSYTWLDDSGPHVPRNS